MHCPPSWPGCLRLASHKVTRTQASHLESGSAAYALPQRPVPHQLLCQRDCCLVVTRRVQEPCSRKIPSSYVGLHRSV